MHYLVGQYRLTIRINDEDIDLFQIKLEKLEIFESVTEALPNIKLILEDDHTLSEEVKVYDGSKITIGLTPLVDNEDTEIFYVYRVFSVTTVPRTYGDRLEIVAYLDASDYLKDIQFQSIDGTSRDVARLLARQSNLEFEGDFANDRQTWIRCGQTGFLWLTDVSRHAYNNSSSAYVFCVTRSGRLKFCNIDTRRNLDVAWKFVSTDDIRAPHENDEILIEDIQIRLNSGILNRWAGYGRLSSEFDIVAGDIGEGGQYQVNRLDKSTDYLEINKELRNVPRYDSSPFNVGNVHDNYVRAELQNRTLISTFSTNVRCISRSIKEVQLLDRVSFSSVKRRGNVENRIALNGNFFVDKIKIDIYVNSVVVLYNLVREGVNNTDVNPDLI